MKALQREANRDLLAVCPPPTKLQREKEKEEVDRMPMNSVNNPLVRQHEE